jgi:hypothetical protein
MVKHEQTQPVLIAEMLFAAGDDRQAVCGSCAVLFGFADNQCLVVAADAVRYGLIRLQLLQEGSELRRGKGDCFRLSLAHPAFRGIFDKLAVRQLHALGQNARSFTEQGEGNALLLPACVFGQTHAAEMQAFAAHECLVSIRSNACSCMLRMRGGVRKETGRMGIALLSVS